jgi:hypothetical protein
MLSPFSLGNPVPEKKPGLPFQASRKANAASLKQDVI